MLTSWTGWRAGRILTSWTWAGRPGRGLDEYPGCGLGWTRSINVLDAGWTRINVLDAGWTKINVLDAGWTGWTKNVNILDTGWMKRTNILDVGWTKALTTTVVQIVLFILVWFVQMTVVME